MYAVGILIPGLCFSQKNGSKTKASFSDGIVVAGYVDYGAYQLHSPKINFTHKDLNLLNIISNRLLLHFLEHLLHFKKNSI